MNEPFGQFLIRLFGEVPPENVDAAYLFGETADNEMSVLKRAFDVYWGEWTSRVVIPGIGPIAGYPGCSAWRTRLMGLGIPPESILLAGSETQAVSNCYTEAMHFVALAKASGWKRAAVIAPHFHLPRCFITMVSGALQDYPALRLYAVPGVPLPWQETVVHNQGVLNASRADLIATEFERIVRYTEKGDLLPVERILEYLDARDR